MNPVRRIVFWLLSTLSILVLLFGYHTSTSGPNLTASPPAVVSSGSGQSSGSGSGSRSSAASHQSSQQGSQQSSQQSSSPSTVTGAVAQTQWGPVQVQLTVAGGSITNVAVVQYPSGNGTDAQINSYALPILMRETVDQQSANIDMVSGATVTSTGYLQSLQSAIDQAGL